MKSSKNIMITLLRLSEAAKMLGVVPQTLRNWDKQGKIKMVRTVGNQRRVPLSEVERLQSLGSWSANKSQD